MARTNNYKQYKKFKVDPSVYYREKKNRESRQEGRLFLSQVFVVASFFLMMLSVGVLSLFLPKPTESLYERRELAKMPAFSVQELFWGSYLREVELFYADTFPFRDHFVRLAATVDETRGIRMDGIRLIEAAPAAPTPPVTDTVSTQEPQVSETASKPSPAGEAKQPQQEAPPPAPQQIYQVEDDGAIGEQTSDGLFIYKNRVMAIFGGNKELGSYYARTLSGYAAALGPDVKVYNAVIPTAIEFGLPERYKSISNSEKNAIDHIYSELKGVVPVDAYGDIGAHGGEYLYFNTDHHWTGRGAYYAYTAYCKAAGLTPLAIEDYDKRQLANPFLGTLYNQTNDSAVRSGADIVEYYVPPGEFEVYRYQKNAPDTPIESTVFAEFATGANSYGVFLHGDYPLVEMHTGVNNGRKAVVIKESFGNAFAPYLLSHYEEVYVVDHRHFQKGLVTFIKEKEINDVIFLKNVFAANTRFHIEYIENMMY